MDGYTDGRKESKEGGRKKEGQGGGVRIKQRSAIAGRGVSLSLVLFSTLLDLAKSRTYYYAGNRLRSVLITITPFLIVKH